MYSNALYEEGLFRIPGSAVKIKKLKNAINAWFVTLASQTELENGQQQTVRSGSPSLLAIYSLFKDIAGQRKPLQTTSSMDSSSTVANNQPVATTIAGRDDSTLTHTNLQPTILSSSSSQEAHQQPLVFDVHTIAGLLKLYLRELSEPLFTYALYDQWIDATLKTLNTNNRTPSQVNSSEPIIPVSSSTLIALGKVVEQLPKANYDNLRLLIRFLHTLTCHREFNRMTATNLAITMAPSLIWSNPMMVAVETQPSFSSDDHHLAGGIGVGGEQAQVDEMHALNMQMSNVGISASLHALVIENLIHHAETLFPDSICFTLSELDEPISTTNRIIQGGDDQKAILSKSSESKLDRCMKSTSPTGLSTASSSSFSSTASVTSSSAKTAVATTSNKISHGRRRGSMDGLLKDVETNIYPIAVDNDNSNGRPMSVNISQQQEHSLFQAKQLQQQQQQQPPPIPPAPVARSHSRQASESSVFTTHRSSTTYKHKAPAPPPCALKRQPKITPHSDQVPDYRARALNKQASTTGTSLRGTGIASQPATRPNVPPPNRPAFSEERATPSTDTIDSGRQQSENVNSMKTTATKYSNNFESNPNQADNKSSDSVTSSVNLRADFEEINAAEVDDIDSSAQISPIISLESISGEDSSFDDECPSLEHSWTECELEQGGQNQTKLASKNSDSHKVTKMSADNQDFCSDLTKTQIVKPTPRLQRRKKNLSNDSDKEDPEAKLVVSDVGRNNNEDRKDDNDKDNDDDGEDTLTAAPIKTPKSTSPKVTQSTLL